jgi:hypothetical protein
LTWTIRLASNSVVTFQADYALTKDFLLYGVITKIEHSNHLAIKDKEKLPEEDDTFSFRFRVDDGDELAIRSLKGKGFEQLKKAVGRYKRQPNSPRPMPSKDKGKLTVTGVRCREFEPGDGRNGHDAGSSSLGMAAARRLRAWGWPQPAGSVLKSTSGPSMTRSGPSADKTPAPYSSSAPPTPIAARQVQDAGEIRQGHWPGHRQFR